MASLAPPPAQTGRISQLLPTVKCSNCNNPVPLDQLEHHVCAPAPAAVVPKSVHDAPQPSLLALRLQSMVTPTRTPSPGSPTADARSSARTISMSSQDTRSSYSTVRGEPSHDSFRPSARGVTPTLQIQTRLRNPPSPHAISRQTTPTPAEPIPRTPSSASYRPRAPSSASTRPRLESAPPDVPPTTPLLTSRPRAPSNASTRSARPSNPPSPYPLSRAPSTHYPPPSPAPKYAPPPTPQTPHPEIDTKIGGEAGMAGVGRRGFAAAARAAMFVHSPGGHSPGGLSPGMLQGPPPGWLGAPSPQGMDGRRANAPRWLDIGSDASRPPPNGGPTSPHSLSPHSPRSPYSDHYSHPPQPSTPPAKLTITVPNVRDPSPGPSSSIPFPTQPAPGPPPVRFMEPKTPTTPMTPRLPFFEKYQQRKNITVAAPREDVAVRIPLSPTTSDSDFGGLAYARSDSEPDDDIPPVPPVPLSLVAALRASTSSSIYPDDAEGGGEVDMGALMMDGPMSPESPMSPAGLKPVKLPTRSLTAPSQRESGMGMLGRASVVGRRGGTISGAIGSGSGKEKEVDKEAEKDEAKDSGRRSRSGSVAKKPKPKSCVRCARTIDDGRWIRVENGKGVLCDKCWKNMYLPKCRRCNLPIEKQAVSSSDGQLKGKYHRECFNCHTCHKPFPDREFYVFDGKPFCDYHYHEANDSLCAAPDCGRPIEGPCAVSHAGGRYHPDHLTCEYEEDSSSSDDDDDEEENERRGKVRRAPGRGRRCTERLAEYWEVEGRMLCERHMHRAVESERMGRVGGGRESRAMKRVTRFIDLAGLGGSGLR
ncbi:hypothetical protein BV25DRAFT_1916232 [Artomyces pyxidatus]|uniref:Uncharacterized protein n=1 Tax=Artomyces pyxidatus TaxID=48021 RepID=A0ACB8T0X6_9AGAM|nr:hypothetical protein BV25DRAFT_1916232 [Artomyces pyxidatus]